MALEWGEQWLRPINERLAVKHPNLGAEEIEAYNKACREAMFHGFDQVVACLRAADQQESRARAAFGSAMRARYPWMSPGNLARVYSQGCYYAWKDGGM